MQKKIVFSKDELLFYMAFLIWLILKVIGTTTYTEIIPYSLLFKLGRIVVYALLFLKFIYRINISFKSLVGISVIVLVFIVSYFSGITTIVDTILLIFSTKNIEKSKLIRISCITLACTLMFVMVSSFCGIIEDWIYSRSEGTIRHSLGFQYCTNLSTYYFYFVLMVIVIKRNNLRMISNICLLLVNWLIYIYTDSVTGFVLVTAALISTYCIKFSRKELCTHKVISFLFQYCFFICAIFTIIVTIKYSPSNAIMFMINKMLNYRLGLSNVAYKEYGFTLFGKAITWSGGIENYTFDSSTYNYVDSSYIQIGLSYGILLLIIICLGFTLLEKKAIKENNKELALVLFFVSIYSIMQPQLIFLHYNPLILLLGQFINTDNVKKLQKRRKYYYESSKNIVSQCM